MQEWQSWGLSCPVTAIYSQYWVTTVVVTSLLAADDISHAELSITLGKYHFNFIQ